MRCEYEHDDGAYVLGALSPTERAAYERHLATCSFCREAVADIAGLPGLLGRLDPADLARLTDPGSAPPPPPAVRVPRRRSRVLVGALAAAVALVVGVGAVLVRDDGTPDAPLPQGPTVAMVPVATEVPVTAQINVAGANGGTRVNLVCFYARDEPSLKPYTIRLVAYGPDDEQEQLGSWVASPGREFSMSGVTHFTGGTLSRLELVRNDGSALLAYDVP